jgi:hypothetical protein
VHNATNSSDLQHASESIGVYSSIIKAIEEAEMAADQSKEASDKALKVIIILVWMPQPPLTSNSQQH